MKLSGNISLFTAADGSPMYIRDDAIKAVFAGTYPRAFSTSDEVLRGTYIQLDCGCYFSTDTVDEVLQRLGWMVF